MARNSELIRQWETLRDIDGARNGITIGTLAAERRVCQRTIRRDLDALERAGFPIRPTKINGTTMWTLIARPFGRLEETGLGVMELCALYFSRTLLETMPGAPLLDEAERAFAKIERALPAGCRRFLDQLPRVLKAKAAGQKQHDDRHTSEILARALDATLLHRRVTMRYASVSSRRTKDYIVEPQRMVHAHGGLYLVAWVPEYGEIRHFAAERIQTLGLLDETFEPRALPTEPFADSLGVNTGTPEQIVIEFTRDAAAFVRERKWHKSQQVEDGQDGALTVTLNVCNDRPLLAWILSFGPDARVVYPVGLAQEVFEAANRMRQRYMRTLRAGSRVELLSMRVS
jgi:predicted DNA-binding transcriptional regulator YafY